MILFDAVHILIVMALLPDEVIARFWLKVQKTDDCWNWTASTQNKGYGQFRCTVDGKKSPRLAHRIAWALANGRWPEPEEFICHTCDNPRCVRIDHLFLGDHDTNMADMSRKGRHWTRQRPELVKRGATHYLRLRPSAIRRGVEIGNHTLTEDLVLRARALRSLGYTYEDIAHAVGCSKSQAFRVCKGACWKHVG